jgi:hypothetical protein
VGFREVGTTNTHLLFEWSDADETLTTLRHGCPPALSPRDENGTGVSGMKPPGRHASLISRVSARLYLAIQ